MGLIIEDGMGSGVSACVSSENRLKVASKVGQRIYYCSRDDGDCYTIVSNDAAPTAADFLLWIQNNSETNFVIHKIITGAEKADVVWKLWDTSGQTGTTAALITPRATNLTSSVAADLTCRGGDQTVAGLTASSSQTKLLHMWYQGTAYNTMAVDMSDSIRLGQNQSIAVEYDSGTAGTSSIVVLGFFDELT